MGLHLKSYLVLLSILAMPSAHAGTIDGMLQGPSGITINNATLNFSLQQAGLIIGSGSVVPLTTSCYTSTDGTVIGIPTQPAT